MRLTLPDRFTRLHHFNRFPGPRRRQPRSLGRQCVELIEPRRLLSASNSLFPLYDDEPVGIGTDSLSLETQEYQDWIEQSVVEFWWSDSEFILVETVETLTPWLYDDSPDDESNGIPEWGIPGTDVFAEGFDEWFAGDDLPLHGFDDALSSDWLSGVEYELLTFDEPVWLWESFDEEYDAWVIDDFVADELFFVADELFVDTGFEPVYLETLPDAGLPAETGFQFTTVELGTETELLIVDGEVQEEFAFQNESFVVLDTVSFEITPEVEVELFFSDFETTVFEDEIFTVEIEVAPESGSLSDDAVLVIDSVVSFGLETFNSGEELPVGPDSLEDGGLVDVSFVETNSEIDRRLPASFESVEERRNTLDNRPGDFDPAARIKRWGVSAESLTSSGDGLLAHRRTRIQPAEVVLSEQSSLEADSFQVQEPLATAWLTVRRRPASPFDSSDGYTSGQHKVIRPLCETGGEEEVAQQVADEREDSAAAVTSASGGMTVVYSDALWSSDSLSMRLDNLSDSLFDEQDESRNATEATYSQMASAFGTAAILGAASVRFTERRGWTMLARAGRRLALLFASRR